MRIGLVIYGSLDTLSGGYLYDRKLVEHLRACGDEVLVFSQPWRSYARHLADNVTGAFTRTMRDANVDVWLQDELNHPSLLATNAVLRRRLVHAPIASIVHHLRVSESHPAALQPLHRVVEGAYLRSCDAFVFNSMTTRDSVRALIVDLPTHVVAYPAADHLPIAPRSGRPVETLRLLTVGNLIERKGLHTTLQALAAIGPEFDWTFDVVGRSDVDPAYAARCRRIAVDGGIADRVHWRGRLDDAQLAQAYAASDALVLPSQYEGFGIVYLEALAAGLPVVASTAGAAGELVRDGVEGWLVPPDDASATAQAIRRLRDGSARQAMSAAARARAAAHPTWSATAARIRTFLMKLCSGANS